MGVKKKHDHESGFFEENLLNEPNKSNRNLQNDWVPHYRNQSPRSIPTAQQTNGESNYLNKPMELLEISRGINNTNNKNHGNYLSSYDRENMSSTGESKSKHSSHNQRTYRNQNESSSNAVQHTIVISDEEDEDEDTRPHNAHSQASDGNIYHTYYITWTSVEFHVKYYSVFSSFYLDFADISYATKSNGQHSKRDSDEIVDITDDDDAANEEDDDDDDRYVHFTNHFKMN